MPPCAPSPKIWGGEACAPVTPWPAPSTYSPRTRILSWNSNLHACRVTSCSNTHSHSHQVYYCSPLTFTSSTTAHSHSHQVYYCSPLTFASSTTAHSHSHQVLLPTHIHIKYYCPLTFTSSTTAHSHSHQVLATAHSHSH